MLSESKIAIDVRSKSSGSGIHHGTRKAKWRRYTETMKIVQRLHVFLALLTVAGATLHAAGTLTPTGATQAPVLPSG